MCLRYERTQQIARELRPLTKLTNTCLAVFILKRLLISPHLLLDCGQLAVYWTLFEAQLRCESCVEQPELLKHTQRNRTAAGIFVKLVSNDIQKLKCTANN